MEFFSEIINFNIIIDILDLILVAALLYYAYKLLKGTVAINIFIGIILIYILWRGTLLLDMEFLSSIIGGFMSVGIIALIVVFQPEIRKFLLMVGSANISKKGSVFDKINFFKNEKIKNFTDVNSIVNACFNMSKSKTGALIIIEINNNLNFLKDSGDEMSIRVAQPILESIFFKNSPLHDGAILIENNQIIATRVILPVSDSPNVPSRYGLRHRAALGISEKTDSLVIVISEQTGKLVYVKNGEFIKIKSPEELKEKLIPDLNE